MIVDLDNVVLNVSGDVSQWNAVGNPIVYRMQRKDFVFDQINNSGGFVQLQFNLVDLTGSFAVSDSVYVKSDNSVYDSAGSVTAESFSTNTLITTNIPYVSAAPGGYVNNDTLRPSYRLEVEVYNADDELITDSAFTYSPNSKGELVIDISTILRSQLSPDIDADLTGSTDIFDDSNVYIGFYIKYREVWSGSAESQTTDSYEFFAVLAARQVPSTYGGNMFEYVTWDDGTPAGRWLTNLDRPKMWRGYTFLASVICGDITGDVNALVTYYDVGGNLIGSNDASLTVENKVLIVNVTEIYAIPDNAATATVVLREVAAGPVVTVISETLTCDILDPCNNPVYLLGRNSLGGVIQWMFDVSQEYTFDYGNQSKAKRLILNTNQLSINQWEALQDFITLGEIYKDNIVEFTEETIKTSTRIGQQVYVVDEDGNKIGVVALPTKNKTLTRQVKHIFELEIEYPEVFVA